MEGEASSRRGPRVFYGYWLVAAAFVFLLLSNGCGAFVYSLFVRPLQEACGWGRGQVMAGFTIYYVVMGTVSPLAGRLVDRYGPRPVISVGAVLMGLGFLAVSRVDNLALFYSAYIVVGAGAACMGPVPCSALVSNWFGRRRGGAVGVMSAGLGIGGLVMAPVVSHLLETFGWQATYVAMAAIIVGVSVPLALAVVRTRPSDMGLHPDGDAGRVEESLNVSASDFVRRGIDLRRSIRTAALWLIGVSFLVSAFSNTGAMHAPVPFLEDMGFPTATAATALGAMGVGSAAGKVFFGWLCDRIHPRFACAIGLVLQLAGILVLLTIRGNSPVAAIWAYALLLGFGLGSWLPSMSTIVSRTFGLAHYGAVFGLVAFLESVGAATGPLFAGFVFDSMGTYFWAFVTFAGLYAISIPAVLLVRRSQASDP